MNTEQLTQFPMGVITEAEVKEHKIAAVTETNEIKTWTTIITGAILGTAVVGAVYLFAISDTIGTNRVSRIESTKALFLIWVAPEKGKDYLRDCISNHK